MRARTAVAAACIAAAAGVGAVVVTTNSSASPSGVDRARNATARYHDVAAARAAGFAELKDAAGIACIDKPGTGGMGIHYVLGARVEDPSIKADEPELVIYAPAANGKLKLAAVEYVVIADAWSAGHSTGPSLFGQPFTLVPEPNRYGLPPFYELHAWIWDTNKAGMFADFNPAVSCP